MAFCIDKGVYDTMEKNGVFHISDSVKREQAFSKYFNPTDAQFLNNKFEHTKLLKKSEIGFSKMIDDLTGVNTEAKAELKANMAAEIARKQNLLKDLRTSGEIKSTAALDIEKVANDIYKKKYNLTISTEQANKVVQLTQEVQRTLRLPKLPNGNFSDEYGLAVSNLQSYVDELKFPSKNLSFTDTIKHNFNTLGTGLKGMQGKPYLQATHAVAEVVKAVLSPTLKSLKATLDASFIGIQGPAFATRNPEVFADSIKKSFAAFADKDAMKAFEIRMYSDKDYAKALLAGTRLLSPEEQFASTLAEKIPGLGRLVKGSDDAFTMFLQNSRFGEFKRVLRNTETKLGRPLDASVEADLKTLKEIASHANKVTGTSNLGSAERYSGLMNQALFAGRYAVSDIRNFTDIVNPMLSSEARKRSVETLALNLGTLYGAYLTYAVLNPDTTEINPNNANFMKVNVGNNVWVGPKLKGQWLIQLISKLVEGKEVSASGMVTEYGKGYKTKTKGDVILHTVRGKLAPVPSVLTDITIGKDFTGQKITTLGELKNLTAPISATNIIERGLQGNQDLKDQLILGFMDASGLSGYQVGSRY